MTYTIKAGCYHQTYNTLEAIAASVQPGAGATPQWPNEIRVPMIHNTTGEHHTVNLTASGPIEYTIEYTEDWSDEDWAEYLTAGDEDE